MLGWGGVYDNALIQLQTCQNLIIIEKSKKYSKYSRIKIYLKIQIF